MNFVPSDYSPTTALSRRDESKPPMFSTRQLRDSRLTSDQASPESWHFQRIPVSLEGLKKHERNEYESK